MKKLSPIVLLLLLISCNSHSQKMNGVNFVSENSVIDSLGYNGLKEINAGWVAWIPYSFCQATTGEILFNSQNQWKGESIEGTVAAIKLARTHKLKMMIKPHVWMSDHSFTGTISLNAEQWKKWQTGYSDYILTFAKLAEQHNVELFCIGTEQFAAIQYDTAYWYQLIEEIKKVYSGKLCYAENWDSYKKCPFWDQLDYIGIDAYFPLSDEANPTVDELVQKWSSWKSEIESTSLKFNRPVLFTEFGYRTTEYASQEPWKDVTDKPYCEECQQRVFQALFQSFWNENWFAGGFLWKWFEPGKSALRENKKSYFIEGKKAEEAVKNNFN